VGLDDVDPARHNSLRGSPDSYREAVNALRAFHDAGVFTYTNTCLTKGFVRSGDLWALLEMARGLGVGAVRLLEPKPCGGFFGAAADELFSEDDRTLTSDVFIRANTMREHRNLPLVCYEAYFESPSKMGCMMGGLSHFSIDSQGYVIPCVFLPVAFGNVLEEDIVTIYSRMRTAIPRPLRRQCPSNMLAPVIKQKTEAGLRLPIPFEDFREEWEALWRQSADRSGLSGESA
jgi:MoaA/NifB/PqqE/SkfB family radical SAM enzyme